MKKSFKEIIGTPIVADDVGRPIALVQDLLIDTDRGKIAALIVRRQGSHVIVPMDIRYWGKIIRVSGAEVIISANEVVRVNEVLEKNISVMGNKVETENGKFLGKVVDYLVDTESLDLLKIFVSRTLIGIISVERRVLSSKEIIEITKDKIIVKDDLVEVKNKEMEAQAVLGVT